MIYGHARIVEKIAHSTVILRHHRAAVDTFVVHRLPGRALGANHLLHRISVHGVIARVVVTEPTRKCLVTARRDNLATAFVVAATVLAHRPRLDGLTNPRRGAIAATRLVG